MGIQKIQLWNTTLSQFVSQVSDALHGRELGKIVSVNVNGSTLAVSFQKLGRSELEFEFQGNAGQKLIGTLKHEKIALAHRAFRGDIEKKLSKVLVACGAELNIE